MGKKSEKHSHSQAELVDWREVSKKYTEYRMYGVVDLVESLSKVPKGLRKRRKRGEKIVILVMSFSFKHLPKELQRKHARILTGFDGDGLELGDEGLQMLPLYMLQLMDFSGRPKKLMRFLDDVCALMAQGHEGTSYRYMRLPYLN